MKGYKRFRAEAIDAIETLALESKGFKNDGDKKRRKKKRKRGYLSPREAKLLDLKQRPQSWSGLESTQDPRTPSTYFVKKRTPPSVRIVEKLMEGKFIGAEHLIKQELTSRLGKKIQVRNAALKAAIEIEEQVFGD